MRSLLVVCLTLVLPTQTPGHWLDRPLAGWNVSGGAVPPAPRADEPLDELIRRCSLQRLARTVAQREVAAAGWIPFLLFDRELIRQDVEAIGGMAASDGMCRPDAFNVFVFVGGRFAGTLSPAPMSARTDGTAGTVRLSGDDAITAEFARYQPSDALCCPSSRVTVTFRISRDSGPPLVAPVSLRTTRG